MKNLPLINYERPEAAEYELVLLSPLATSPASSNTENPSDSGNEDNPFVQH